MARELEVSLTLVRKIIKEDFWYFWGVTEGDVNKAPHNTKESLIVKIMEVFANMFREKVALACNQFRSRLEKVIAANGDFIEYIYSSIFNKHCHKKLLFYWKKVKKGLK